MTSIAGASDARRAVKSSLSVDPFRLAIIGAGPTCLYLLHALQGRVSGCTIDIYEKGQRAGSGLPYAENTATRLMLANIASIEMPRLEETLLAFLRRQDDKVLSKHGLCKDALHERSFVPRVLIGRHLERQFALLVRKLRLAGNNVRVRSGCAVHDIIPCGDNVLLRADGGMRLHDMVVMATGHQFPSHRPDVPRYFASPYSGLLEQAMPAVRYGIMGSSLTACDAVFALAEQHGAFKTRADGALSYVRYPEAGGFAMTMMSRKGLLPEADFYHPLPYRPLAILDDAVVTSMLAAGSSGLLDAIFALMRRELQCADPAWCQSIGLDALDADSFPEAYFAARKATSPFDWAARNLAEVERNHAARRTVEWRYALLRMHETVERCVPQLGPADRRRFDNGLAQVFIDNYAAVPCETIRRLLALREAGVLDLVKLGQGYDCNRHTQQVVPESGQELSFDFLIDATGQRALKPRDLPFRTLRTLIGAEERFRYDNAFMLRHRRLGSARIALLALPYLLDRRPFAQGLVACDEIARRTADCIVDQLDNRAKSQVPVWQAALLPRFTARVAA